MYYPEEKKATQLITIQHNTKEKLTRTITN